MSLTKLRQQVLFHNSIDVWIAACDEKNISWNDTEKYKKFIEYLLKNNLNLKAFTLCSHEAGETEKEKTEFAETLRQQKEKDPNAATYTIKLNEQAIDVIRNFDFEN